jgi:hypothetical protein
MWSAAIGIILILAGLGVAVLPILFGFHLQVVDGRLREVRTKVTPISGSLTIKCAHCGEAMDDTYYMFTPNSSEREPSLQFEAS